jgi:excisionase family DNA binding protein
MGRVRAIAPLADLGADDLGPVRDFLVEHGDSQVAVELVAEDGARTVVPTQVSALVRRILSATADGQHVDLVSDVDEVTPNEASELLGVSRNTVLRLIAEGDLTARTLPGSRHRRLPRTDVLDYRDRRSAVESALARAADLAEGEGVWDTTLEEQRAT